MLEKRNPVNTLHDVAGHDLDILGHHFAHFSCNKCNFESSQRPELPKVYPIKAGDGDLCKCGKTAQFTKYQPLFWGTEEGYVPICRWCAAELIEEYIREDIDWLKNLSVRCSGERVEHEI